MNTGTVLLIGGIVLAGVILMSKSSAPDYGPYVPRAPAGGESDLNAGANAVGSALSGITSSFFGAAQAGNWF